MKVVVELHWKETPAWVLSRLLLYLHSIFLLLEDAY